MSAHMILQDSLAKRKQNYSGKLAILARKRELLRRDIETIDDEVAKIEAALREVQQTESDWQIQQQAIEAEEKIAQDKEKGA